MAKRRTSRGLHAAAGASSLSLLDNPALWLREVEVARRTSSGERVGVESALALSAYWACINNLSQDAAKIPLQLRQRRQDRGSDEVTKHPAWALVRRRPNPLMGPYQFRQTMQHRRLAWGNSYAELVRNDLGQVVEMWPVHPLRITPKIGTDGRSVEYEYRPDGKTLVGEPLAPRDLLHLRGMGSGLEGWSVIRFASESLGLGLASQRHAAAFYGEGMSKRLVAVAKQVLSPKGREEFRKRLKGDQENDSVGSRKLPFLEGDIDLKEVGISPDEAQFLESRTFSVPEVARWFRMSLAKIQHEGGGKGWSTLEALNRDYWTDALHPLAVEWEEELWLKLLTEQEQNAGLLYFRHVFQALLRADYGQRWQGYQVGLDRGVLSPNDVRELEDMNPITLPNGKIDPAGDTYRTQMQNQPLTVTPAASAPAASGTGVAAASASMRPAFLDAARRMVGVEANAASRAIRQTAKAPGAFATWAAEFASGHTRTVVDAFAPLLSSLCLFVGRPVPPADAIGAVYVALGPVTPTLDVDARTEALASAMLALVSP